MNRLWAPWRIAYVGTTKKTKGCVFCKAYKSTKDKTHFVVLRSQSCFAILNLFPYNNGHMMVVTNRHIKSLQKLTDGELLDVMHTTRRVISLLKKTLEPDGFNVGINLGISAGAGIASHLHIHIVPRWQGDTNYMPVVGSTKIISQGLQELYQSLKKCLRDKT